MNGAAVWVGSFMTVIGLGAMIAGCLLPRLVSEREVTVHVLGGFVLAMGGLVVLNTGTP